MRDKIIGWTVAFAMGVGAAFFIPWLVSAAASNWLFPPERTEIARITSPDGAVDAVTEQIDYCGAPCSTMYEVSIVPKGAPASNSTERQVFVGEDVSKGKVGWDESHLLAISYDGALIDMFHNVAYPLAQRGRIDRDLYMVEVHLSPTSPKFSYLPDPSRNVAPK